MTAITSTHFAKTKDEPKELANWLFHGEERKGLSVKERKGHSCCLWIYNHLRSSSVVDIAIIIWGCLLWPVNWWLSKRWLHLCWTSLCVTRRCWTVEIYTLQSKLTCNVTMVFFLSLTKHYKGWPLGGLIVLSIMRDC